MIKVLLFGIGLTLAIELLCCLFRFRFRFRSREIQRRWLGVRIHHGYCGVVLVPLLWFLPSPWIAAVAAALILSDLIHHFVILPIFTGQMD